MKIGDKIVTKRGSYPHYLANQVAVLVDEWNAGEWEADFNQPENTKVFGDGLWWIEEKDCKPYVPAKGVGE